MRAGLRSTPSTPPEPGSAPLSEATWAESRQFKGEGPSLSERQAEGASFRAWTEGRACAVPQRSPDTLYPYPHAYTLTLSHAHIPSQLTFTHAHTLTLTYIPVILTFTHMLTLTYSHTHTLALKSTRKLYIHLKSPQSGTSLTDTLWLRPAYSQPAPSTEGGSVVCKEWKKLRKEPSRCLLSGRRPSGAVRVGDRRLPAAGQARPTRRRGAGPRARRSSLGRGKGGLRIEA